MIQHTELNVQYPSSKKILSPSAHGSLSSAEKRKCITHIRNVLYKGIFYLHIYKQNNAILTV